MHIDTQKDIHMYVYGQMLMHILLTKPAAGELRSRTYIFIPHIQGILAHHTKTERGNFFLPTNWYYWIVSVPYGKQAQVRFKNTGVTEWSCLLLDVLGTCAWWWSWYATACCNTASRRSGIQRNSSSPHPHSSLMALKSFGVQRSVGFNTFPEAH